MITSSSVLELARVRKSKRNGVDIADIRLGTLFLLELKEQSERD